jgi:hypothetical protein
VADAGIRYAIGETGRYGDTVTVYLCHAGLTPDECVPGGNQGGTATAPPESLPATLIATTDDQDLQMSVSTDPASLARFQTLLRRSGWFVWYTYVIAAMPFILLIALFSAYAWRRKNEKTGKVIQYAPARAAPTVHEIAFGVAAALVAILPLRAVLIPSSLPGLTRLDIVFSTGAALLVALSVSWVFVWKEETAMTAETRNRSSGVAVLSRSWQPRRPPSPRRGRGRGWADRR